ncbi:hypothetical protein TNCT_212511 [Trichonephila clavata]|uniref:Uncharacterized protein n=1 Tax=Trichonephila clavata TaxID=2740835 RepID=A0A8X6HZL8_TRICU|nr:hypothetical protein TNCT_212511 [Trichonephila clavata]
MCWCLRDDFIKIAVPPDGCVCIGVLSFLKVVKFGILKFTPGLRCVSCMRMISRECLYMKSWSSILREETPLAFQEAILSPNRPKFILKGLRWRPLPSKICLTFPLQRRRSGELSPV